jgi:hypothetical protein
MMRIRSGILLFFVGCLVGAMAREYGIKHDCQKYGAASIGRHSVEFQCKVTP